MDIKRKDIIDIKGKSITIIGLARSGVAAAKLAHKLGSKVFISDISDSPEVHDALKTLM